MKTNLTFHHSIACYDKEGIPCTLEVFGKDNNPFTTSVIMHMTKKGLVRGHYIRSRPHVKPQFMSK